MSRGLRAALLDFIVMLHKFFQWVYRVRRPGSNPLYRKIEGRSKERDLIQYFHQFGDYDTANSQRSRWLLKGISKVVSFILILALAIWFAYESYHGLLIYD